MPLSQRSVHPSIADPDPNAVRNGTAPVFQYPDGKWNHGEGFAPPGTPDEDYGGWHGHDDGSNVGPADIHIPPYDSGLPPTPNSPVGLWHDYPWQALHPHSPETVEKLHGYLRPEGIPLPDTHPLMLTREAKLFPREWGPDQNHPNGGDRPPREWAGLNRGYYCPDGLVCDEGPNGFLADTAAAVDRQPPQDIANWKVRGGHVARSFGLWRFVSPDEGSPAEGGV